MVGIAAFIHHEGTKDTKVHEADNNLLLSFVVLRVLRVFVVNKSHRSLKGAPESEEPPALYSPTIGRSTPRSRAVSMASSYPASACRMTPVPGSAVSTRSSRRSAMAVPSATATIPAWIE